ncbi:MAG: PEP-CTERM sorting domain-containing protein [Planctomycetota bacterium]
MVRCWLGLLVAALVLALAAPASALTIPVMHEGQQVGTITANVSPDGKGVIADFTSSVGGPPPTLDAAAQQMGEHHFNWGQVVLEDSDPPNDADGNPLVPPYLDPPPGGYENQWADNLPWYWDETEPPDPKPATWEPGYGLSDNTESDKLNFEDYPWGAPGLHLKFGTFLISCNADGSLHSIHEGFTWTWDRPESGGGLDGSLNRNIYDEFVPFVGQQIFILGPADPSVAGGLFGPAVVIPEPATLALMGAGLLALARRRRAA